MPMKRRPSCLATAPVVPVPKKGSSDDVAGLGRGEQHALQQRLRFLRRMRLAAAVVLQALRPRADREQPVGAHLQVVVQRLEALVVERRARALVARRPDQRLVRVGEALAAEVRHRVHLAPDDVVLDPEAEILQRDAEAEDVVIGADHPDGAVRLQDAAAFGEPGAREGVVLGEAARTCPNRRRRRRRAYCSAASGRWRAADCRAGRRRRDRRNGRAASSRAAMQSPTMTRLAEAAAGERRRTMGTQLSQQGEARAPASRQARRSEWILAVRGVRWPAIYRLPMQR